MAPDSEGLEITYPCSWGYRVIGTAEAEMRAVITAAVGEARHELTFGRSSSKGRYVSLHLTVLVEDDEHRRAIHAAIRGADCVRMVL